MGVHKNFTLVDRLSLQRLQIRTYMRLIESHFVASGVASGDKSLTRDQGIKGVAENFPMAIRHG